MVEERREDGVEERRRWSREEERRRWSGGGEPSHIYDIVMAHGGQVRHY